MRVRACVRVCVCVRQCVCTFDTHVFGCIAFVYGHVQTLYTVSKAITATQPDEERHKVVTSPTSATPDGVTPQEVLSEY